MSFFDILTIKRTELLGDAKTIVKAIFQAPARAPGDDEPIEGSDDETLEADLWQHYGFVSRPPKNAQALYAQLGANIVAIATRVITAAKVFGSLGEGDVAVFSIAGNVIRLNANGSISVLVPTANGKQFVARIDPKGAGSLKMANGAGMAIEFSEENGVVINVGDKDVTIACGNFQVVGKSTNLYTASTRTWAGAKAPFAGGTTMLPAPGLMV